MYWPEKHCTVALDPHHATISRIDTRDARFTLRPGEGSDAVHTEPVYAFSVARLHTDGPHAGTGLTFTLGAGNDLVCRAIEYLGEKILGREIEDLMASFGQAWHGLAEDQHLRWLGPHKGVVHLALAALSNACFDLWAKARGVPLWRLLLDLEPRQVAALCDFSYVDDELTSADAVRLLGVQQAGRADRMGVIEAGYPGYDTSVGWFTYPDDQIVENAKRALDSGFTALKLKVGSKDTARDVRRTHLVREAVGPDVRLMVDANQQWTLPVAREVCARLAGANLYWVEEPTHPDDVAAHRVLAQQVAPTHIALGEHVPNRVVFKNFMQSGAVGIVQVDALRVGGVGEFLTVSLLARKFGLPVVPHVGDMGQLHQHLVLFNHIALGHEKLFLESIPHLAERFVHPAEVRDGAYHTPHHPGTSCDLKE